MFKEKTLYNIEMVCCIYLLTNPDGYGYIGKTTNLQQRLRVHKSNNKCFSKLLGDDKECIILEECDEDCLDDYERYYYDIYKEIYGDKIVNGRRPSPTREERRKQNNYHQIEHVKANRETILKYQKQYREANREKAKEYAQANREKAKEYEKKYRGAKRLKQITDE
jgi:hypothetical protein